LRHTPILTEGCQSGVNSAPPKKAWGLKIIFLGRDLWCFIGFFVKGGGLIVVFWWCRCGGSVVKRGVLAVTFGAAKDAPNFLDLFSEFPFLECGGRLSSCEGGAARGESLRPGFGFSYVGSMRARRRDGRGGRSCQRRDLRLWRFCLCPWQRRRLRPFRRRLRPCLRYRRRRQGGE
jgi:hypothetical protein